MVSAAGDGRPSRRICVAARAARLARRPAIKDNFSAAIKRIHGTAPRWHRQSWRPNIGCFQIRSSQTKSGVVATTADQRQPLLCIIRRRDCVEQPGLAAGSELTGSAATARGSQNFGAVSVFCRVCARPWRVNLSPPDSGTSKRQPRVLSYLVLHPQANILSRRYFEVRRGPLQRASGVA